MTRVNIDFDLATVVIFEMRLTPEHTVGRKLHPVENNAQCQLQITTAHCDCCDETLLRYGNVGIVIHITNVCMNIAFVII